MNTEQRSIGKARAADAPAKDPVEEEGTSAGSLGHHGLWPCTATLRLCLAAIRMRH